MTLSEILQVARSDALEGGARKADHLHGQKLYNESITLFRELGEKHSTANALKELKAPHAHLLESGH